LPRTPPAKSPNKNCSPKYYAVAHRHSERAADPPSPVTVTMTGTGSRDIFAQISRNRFNLAAFLRVNSR